MYAILHLYTWVPNTTKQHCFPFIVPQKSLFSSYWSFFVLPYLQNLTFLALTMGSLFLHTLGYPLSTLNSTNTSTDGPTEALWGSQKIVCSSSCVAKMEEGWISHRVPPHFSNMTCIPGAKPVIKQRTAMFQISASSYELKQENYTADCQCPASDSTPGKTVCYQSCIDKVETSFKRDRIPREVVNIKCQKNATPQTAKIHALYKRQENGKTVYRFEEESVTVGCVCSSHLVWRLL